MAKEVTKRSDNYSQWYDNLVVKADLAERSAVRGCMVIKPYGYAICTFSEAQACSSAEESNGYYHSESRRSAICE